MAERNGFSGRELLARLVRSDCLWRLGRWSESLADVSLVIAIDEAAGASMIASLARCQIARVEAGLGLDDACRADAWAAIDAAVGRGLPYPEAQARAALVLLDLGAGDHKAAADEVDRLAALVTGAPHPGWLWWQADAIEALHGAGHTAAARTQLEGLVEGAEHTGNRWAAAAVERSRALLGLADPVPACTRAMIGFGELDAPFDEARAQLLRGEWRQRAGDEAGVADLTEAAARFHRLGAAAWQARAVRSIDGARAPQSLSAHLSAAELRVAHAVGRGASNRQVADELYVSIKTVESHLGSIYRKLGVRRRTQLVVLMANPETWAMPDA
jgi:DNA-binding CsgD family transcriptional regulator